MSYGPSYDYPMKTVLSHMPKKTSESRFRPFSHQVLRYSYHDPTTFSESSGHVSIVLAVICNLFLPKSFVCFWKSKTPRAAVPKTPIDKNSDFSRFPKSKIGSAREVEMTTPPSDTKISHAFFKPLLGRKVTFWADAFHNYRTFSFGKNVGHKDKAEWPVLSYCKLRLYNKIKFISSISRCAADTYIRFRMITSSHVLAGILKAFEPFGWKVHHRYDHNPALINKLGYGDRRFGKSDDENPVYIPEPNLTLSKKGKGLVVEVDFKYSKKSFSTIETIRNIKGKQSYLERYFGGRIPKKILYGIAIPNLSLHVARGTEHLKNIDFFLCASKAGEVFKIKAPTNPDFNPLGKFKKFQIEEEVDNAKG